MGVTGQGAGFCRAGTSGGGTITRSLGGDDQRDFAGEMEASGWAWPTRELRAKVRPSWPQVLFGPQQAPGASLEWLPVTRMRRGGGWFPGFPGWWPFPGPRCWMCGSGHIAPADGGYSPLWLWRGRYLGGLGVPGMLDGQCGYPLRRGAGLEEDEHGLKGGLAPIGPLVSPVASPQLLVSWAPSLLHSQPHFPFFSASWRNDDSARLNILLPTTTTNDDGGEYPIPKGNNS